MFLHYITFGWYPKPNMVADFFGATINSQNQKFMDTMEMPPEPQMHPAQRSVSWLDDNFGS
jgi:hypothetical protein